MVNPLRFLIKCIAILFSFIILVILFLFVSGNGHVLTAVQKSILIGQFGPGIYDKELFNYKAIEPSSKNFKFAKVNRLENLSQEALEIHKELESTSFLVLKNDSLISETYWNGHTVLTQSNSFSMAKSVVGSLCAIAVSEGKIKWTDPVGTYLAELRGKSVGKLTFYQLLTMTANSSWTESGGNPFSDNAKAYYGEDLKGLLESVEQEAEPGQIFNYQSGNTALAAWALSEAIGSSVSSYFQEKIWQKIGTEYEAAWSTDEKSGLEKAFCCLYATSRDYARLGRLWLNNGVWDSTEVIPSKQLQYMLEPLNVDYGPCPEACYAISFWIETYRGINFYYARGILGQYIIVIPDKNMLIVRTGKTRMEKTERFHPKDLYIYIDQALALAE